MLIINKDEAIKHLYESTFLPTIESDVSDLQIYFRQHRTLLVEQFVESFRGICRLINNIQQNQAKDPIGYIHYSMLRTSMLEGNAHYLIEAYSSKWYWDDVECLSYYDAGWAYQSLESMTNTLEMTRKKYMNLIDNSDIQRMILQNLGYYNQFVIALARSSLSQAVKLTEYQQINKTDCLRVRIGEFKDYSEDVHVDDRTQKDERSIRRQLKSRTTDLGCAYKSFTGIQLYDEMMDDIDLRYTDFSRSNLQGSKFTNCLLTGTQWNGCQLRHVDFSFSQLCDADFRDCDLEGARFVHIDSRGIQDKLLQVPGLIGLNFENANLEDVDFSYAELEGANFHNAIMKNTTILKENLNKLNLSEVQIESIHWITRGEVGDA
ncbi:MAG TPA: pentapeptide repeat-containing protein [Paenibacillus sp.]